MKRFLREPLLHFVLIGAALFALNAYVNRDARTEVADEASGERIVVSKGRIEQLATIFAKTRQRPPSTEELRQLVDDFVLEELYYRRALEMGLDQDDTAIRRRLRHKLEYLTDGAAALVEPTDEDLEAFRTKHAERFREPPTYSFRQIYFNPEKHGDQPQVFVAEQLERLRSGETDVGDPSILEESFVGATAHSIDGKFGRGFAAQLDGLARGDWHGPVESGLGLHLVRLDEQTAGELPELSSIRDTVEREWRHEMRVQSRATMNERLRSKYEIVVEWPEGDTQASDRVDGAAP